MWGFRHGNGFQKFKIKRSDNDIGTEDIFLDAALAKKQSSRSPGYGRIETALSQKTLNLVFGFFILTIIIFAGWTLYYETAQHNFYLAKAERNKYIFSKIEAQRGIFYDKNFNQLVFNEQTFALVCNYNNLPDNPDLLNIEINEIAKILKITSEDIKQKVEENCKKNVGSVVLYENLDLDKVIVIETKLDDLAGFDIKNQTARHYDSAEDFSLLLGFVSRDNWTGQAGLEKQYDEYLKETPGILQKERGSSNAQEILAKAPEPGNNLLLNIDKDLQKIVAQYLREDIQKYKAKGGSVVIMNPNNGAILSLVSLPSFDNNAFSSTLSTDEYNKMLNSATTSFYNRAIAGEYAIGSTIKPLLAVAALEEGIINPQTIINDYEGGIHLSDNTFKKDWAVHGAVDLKKAIAESCDTYFYTIGGGYQGFRGLGIEKIVKYLNAFGFGKETGIDLPGETNGLLPTPEWKKEKYGTSWYPGDTYNISIGQGYLKTTPLQLAVATSAIANSGKIYQPQIVNSILDKNNNPIKKIDSQLIAEVPVDIQHLKEVQEAMRETVISPQGTARGLQSMPITSAAKTGTAETSRAETYNNLITLFAPYENPEYVITIIIESVPYETGVANLLARQIMSSYFSPSKETLGQESPSAPEANTNDSENIPAVLPDGEGAPP